ncbi:MAG: hypothetical protein AMJ81_13685 [Phycisphaerae bacterium SM23_33]|nr:MAG: hypothetical protein AMJ81_13685 [Phycisphaerae bacterium SM23_33]
MLTNHVHLLIRKHKLTGEEMAKLLEAAARQQLCDAGLVPQQHPVFSADVCDVHKSDPASVRRCVRYIEGNVRKHNLPVVRHDFLSACDNWPFHQRNGPHRGAPR